MNTRVGLYTGEDIRLGDLLLNQVDENMCAWAITDLDGWWGLPDLEVPDDPRPQTEDGSYYTMGRYLPRIISLQGRILPLDGVANKAVAARRSLNRVLAPLVRSRTLLSVDEQDGTRVAMVQLSAQPLTRIDQATGLLEFDIQLKTVDPAKYSSSPYSYSTSLGLSSPGRKYNKTFLYSYGGATTSGTINALNSGSYSTEAIFTITGPVTKPKIEHVESGNFLEFNVVLGVGESLVVNTKSKKITLSGANRRNTMTPSSRWFSLMPGMNTIRYSGTQHIPPQQGNPGGTNLFTNPSFETAGTTYETRRNLAANPGPRTSTLTGWAFQAGTGEATAVSWEGATGAGPEGRTGFWRRTVTTPKTSGTSGPFYRGLVGETVGVAGDVVTISMWVRLPVATTISMSASLRSGTTQVSASANTFPVLANTWTRISATITATASYDGFQSWAAVATNVILPLDGTYDAGNVLFERTSSVLPYFDGALSPDSDLTPSWAGTANASASILSATRVASVTGGMRSSQWSMTGTRSLRVEPGQTATVSVTGPITITARNTGQTATLSGNTAVSSTVNQPLTVTGTGILTLGPGYWDNLGDGITQYFDGSSFGASWTGTPNASTSTSPAIPNVPVSMLQLSYRDAWID